MKAIINLPREVNFLYLKVSAKVRYWEDSTVNGEEDIDGDLIPLRCGDCWCPVIDIETGIILNWKIGTVASISYKVCDGGEYWLVDDNGIEYKYPGDYVPKCLDIDDDGYGDYIYMDIDENGKIEDWKIIDIPDFLHVDD
jgi:hypothetical protein